MVLRPDWCLVTLLGVASGAAAQDCRLALVLALDVSASVDTREDRLQREGLARALLAPEVMRSFLAGDPVALYAFEWSGPSSQADISRGWHMIENELDLAGVAAAVVASHEGRPDQLYRSTAVGSALSYAGTALKAGPSCRARTVDISGDGISNQGDSPAIIYESHLLDGVTVNALMIGGAQTSSGPLAQAADRYLVSWFEREVLHGPGAFWMLADNYEDYERAMRAKLLRELDTPAVSGWPVVKDGA
jgi:hypothetical protein